MQFDFCVDEFLECSQQTFRFRSLVSLTHPCPVLLGKKRAWVPDEKEAYIEIEIKELQGDKVIVETKDGRVSVQS